MLQEGLAPVAMIEPDECMAAGGQEVLEYPANTGLTMIGVMQHPQGHDEVEGALRFELKQVFDLEFAAQTKDASHRPCPLHGDGIEIDAKYPRALVVGNAVAEPAGTAPHLQDSGPRGEIRDEHLIGGKTVAPADGACLLRGALLIVERKLFIEVKDRLVGECHLGLRVWVQ
jgi:hypothetical protein